MAEPQIIGTEDIWIDYQDVDSKGNPKVYTSDPGNIGGVLGMGSRTATHVTRVTYENGETYDFDDEGTATYRWTDPQLRLSYQNKEATGQWTRVTDPQGNVWRLNEATGEKEQVFAAGEEDAEEKALRRRLLQAQVSSAERGPAGRTRFPEEEQLDRLKVQEMQQKLENPYTQRMKYIQQAYKKINELQQAQIRGEMDSKEAERQIKGFYDFIQADMMGATQFQMQKDKQDLAHKVLNTRAQTGSSIAQGLMSTITGAYGKMYSGANPNYNIDYFGMIKDVTDEYTGGQDLNQLGLQILKGAFGGQGGQ